MKQRISVKDVAQYSKGQQINGDDLIKDGQYDYLNGGINPSGKWSEYNVEGGTVTISEGGNSSGYVNYMPNAFWCGAHCYYLYGVTANTKYLYYALKSQQGRLMGIRSGACMPNIKKSDLGNFDFDFDDDKSVQKSVVEILEKTERVIADRKQELEQLDLLIKARFVEMFGDENNSMNWNIVNVENVADVQVGVVIKPSQYYTEKTNGIPAFRSLNIGEGYIKNTDWVYFTKEGHEKNSKSILKENDLLIVRSGAPGTACVVTKEYLGYNAIDVIIAHPDCSIINPFYLCAYTNMPHGKNQILEGTGGAAQQHFNVGKYNKLKLMLPPIEKQNKFIDFVAQVDKSKVAVQKALDETQLLFDSLMQEYFG
jgi:type I restriction enzyme S subunit